MTMPALSQAMSIVATDNADFDEKIGDAILARGETGPLRIVGTVEGVPFDKSLRIHSHEDALAMLDA